MEGKATVKLSLLLGYECNNRCIFCYDGAGYKRGRVLPITTEEAKKKIKEGREKGCNFLDILGGEPTIRRDLIELISYAKSLGYEQIAITTNGQMLSYYDYAKKLVEAGLNHIVFSIHSSRPEVHDFLTQNKGSWERAVKGLKNINKLREEGYEIYVGNNTVITKYNYDHMDETLEFLVEHKINGQDFIFPHPKGRAYVYFDNVVPTLTEIRDYVRKTISKYREIKNKYPYFRHFAFRYLPLCYLYPDIDLSSEYKAYKISFFEKHIGPEFEDWSVELSRKTIGKVKVEQCKRCILNEYCEGIWKEYVEERGTSELIPIYSEKDLFYEALERRLPLAEIIQLIYGLKKSWLFSINEEIADIVYNVVAKNNYHLSISKWKNKDIIIVCEKEENCNKLRELFTKNKKSIEDLKEIGNLLGYPKCCVDFHGKWLRIKDKFGEFYAMYEIYKNSREFYWQLNFFYNFQSRIEDLKEEYKMLNIYININKELDKLVHSLYLIPWIPHSFDCQYSLEIAKKTFEKIEENLPEVAEKIKEILSKPIIFIDRWEWYTFEPDYIRREDGKIVVKIDRIIPPYSPIRNLSLEGKEVINVGDKIIVDNNYYRGFIVIFDKRL